MPGLIQGSQARRSLTAFWVAGALLGAVGLVSSDLEDVAFGHVHLVDGHAVHHYHFYLGPHEHSDPHSLAEADDDHDDDNDLDHHHDLDHHDHDHHHPGAPHSHDHPASQRTATVSAAPALFQPVAFSVPTVLEVLATPVTPAPVESSPARPVDPPSRPRGPPTLSTSRDLPS